MWKHILGFTVGLCFLGIMLLMFSAEKFLNTPTVILSIWFSLFVTYAAVKHFSKFGDDLRGSLLGIKEAKEIEDGLGRPRYKKITERGSSLY